MGRMEDEAVEDEAAAAAFLFFFFFLNAWMLPIRLPLSTLIEDS